MPPSDDPLEDKNAPVEDKTPAADTPAPVTREEFESAIATMDQNVGKSYGQISQKLDAMQTQTPAAPATETPDGETDVQSLVDNPKAFIDKQVAAQLARLRPYFANQISDKYNDLVAREVTNFEDMYGDGSFNKYIQPELDALGDNLTPEMKSSADSMKHLINTYKGQNMDELFEARNTHLKAKQEKDVQDNVPPMLRGGHATPRPGKLSAAEEEFVQRHQLETGKTMDVKSELEFRDKMPQETQMTLSDYAEMIKKEA